VVSAAKPEIGDYPFTTIRPNLGIVSYRDHRSFVMADIPGIIEGASKGKGLGYRFLRHIERNSLLLFMVPADADDIAKEFLILKDELQAYNPELLHKDFILSITKSDMLDEELKEEIRKELATNLKGIPFLFISAVAQTGLLELKDEIWKLLQDD
jgi:GTP-binding protein